MAEEELGKQLTAARAARGLTLHDVERDTRISSKYIKALEAGELDLLPAPVYARAFLRTYAQYLGLNAPEMVQQLPGARPEPVLPALPDVGRDAVTSRLSASWTVAGVVVVVLFAAGLVLFWSRAGGDDAATVVAPLPTQVTAGQGGEVVVPEDEPVPPLEIEAGLVPALERQHVLSAVVALQEAGLTYLVIEVTNGDVPQATVFQQSPSPQTPIDDSTVVTLVVSR